MFLIAKICLFKVSFIIYHSLSFLSLSFSLSISTGALFIEFKNSEQARNVRSAVISNGHNSVKILPNIHVSNIESFFGMCPCPSAQSHVLCPGRT